VSIPFFSKEAIVGNHYQFGEARQEQSCTRERIDAIKKLLPKRGLEKLIARRNIDKRRRMCPASGIVWFIVALWLYGNDSYPQVFRWLHRFRPRRDAQFQRPDTG
jgi:hypothetical protein